MTMIAKRGGKASAEQRWMTMTDDRRLDADDVLITAGVPVSRSGVDEFG